MAAVTIYSDFGAQENKVCHCFHYFPIYLPCRDGTGCHDLRFLNVGLKLNIQKTKIMASGLITSCQIDGKTMETVRDYFFFGSKITVGGDCSHEIKRRLLLGRKVMTNLDSILKNGDITLPTKVHLVKAMFFFSSHVWM